MEIRGNRWNEVKHRAVHLFCSRMPACLGTSGTRVIGIAFVITDGAGDAESRVKSVKSLLRQDGRRVGM
jgi:hypothetical protein